jgi:carbonic anhydrase/acetyltransferase-like protein (isoleucine patch superfamily)
MAPDPRFQPYRGALPRLGRDVFVADSARLIGDVVVGDASSVWYGTVVRGDVFPIRIGARVNLQDLTVVHVTAGRFGTTLGDDVTVGHRAILHGCTVHAGALIGMGAIVMDGAVIGEEALVAAGALVTPGAVIPPRTLAVGSPARARRPLTDEELQEIRERSHHYAALAGDYLAVGLGGPP